MAAPATQRIGTRFGTEGRRWAAGYHTGVDFLTPTGTILKAPADSKIIFAGRGGWGSAYGIHVIGECKGTDGKTYRWATAHMSSEMVTAGQQVRLGATLGRSGATGNVTGPHCHFEVRAYNRSARDGVYGYWDHVNPTVVLNVAEGTSKNKMDPAAYFTGATGTHITWLGQRLVAHGFGKHYASGPGPSWGEADRLNVRDFQLAQGWTGDAADGFPGAMSLTRLAAAVPAVSTPTPALSILPRADWTDEPNERDDRPLDIAKVVAITVHYPADGEVFYRDLSQAKVAEKLRAYRAHHVNIKGWVDIGYNYAIDQAGRVWFLTGDNIGAHSGDVGNTTSIGVLFVIGNNEQPSAQLITAFKELRATKLARFPKAVKVQGHQQVLGNQTSCPGEPLMDAIKSGIFTNSVSDPGSEPPVRATFRGGYGNLFAPYTFTADWNRRAPLLAQIVKDMGVSSFIALEGHGDTTAAGGDGRTELAKAPDGKLRPIYWPFLRALPMSWRVAEGEGGNHYFYDSDKELILKTRDMLMPGRRWMTGWKIRHIATGREFWKNAAHLSAGSTPERIADREAQGRFLAHTIDSTVPVILGADLNNASTYPGSPRASLKADNLLGLRDKSKTPVINGNQPSHDGGKPGQWIDDMLTSPSVTVDGAEVVPTGSLSDHQFLKARFSVSST